MNFDSANNYSKKGIETTLWGIALNAFLAIIKALGGIFGHSYALIADAIESGSDVVTSSLLWLGLKWSSKPPDKNHPYGHGKAEAVATLGISMALLAAAYVISKNSIIHILHPHKTPASYTLIILVIVILIKELWYRYVVKVGKEINSSVIEADAFHHRSDAFTSLAAFIGISITLIGGKGYEAADDWAALAAAAFIVYNIYKIARPAIGELLDEKLEPEFQDSIISISNKTQGVKKVEKCHTRKMGHNYQVDLHLWVNGKLTVEEGHNIAHNVKERLLEKLPQILDVHIHIEPNKE